MWPQVRPYQWWMTACQCGCRSGMGWARSTYQLRAEARSFNRRTAMTFRSNKPKHRLLDRRVTASQKIFHPQRNSFESQRWRLEFVRYAKRLELCWNARKLGNRSAANAFSTCSRPKCTTQLPSRSFLGHEIGWLSGHPVEKVWILHI